MSSASEQIPTPPPPGDSPGDRNLVAMLTREDSHAAQIKSLVHLLASFQAYLLLDTRSSPDTSPELDGGVRDAAVATFSKICDRVDAILEDSSRWNLDFHDQLQKSVIDLQKGQKRLIDSQEQSVKMLRRPSYQLRPTLAMSGTEYLAIWGDMTRPGGAIVGHGPTPNAALLDFDAAFDRTPDAQFILIAENLGHQTEQDTPPANE